MLLDELQTLQIVVWKALTCNEVDFVIAEMDADHVGDKRARLLASKTKWSEMDEITATHLVIGANIGRMSL